MQIGVTAVSGMNTIRLIETFKETATELGFNWKYSRDYINEYGDTVTLIPADDRYPTYVTDTELYAGTIEDAIQFMRGISWHQHYCKCLLGDKFEEQITRKEQDIRNESLRNVLKNNTNKGTAYHDYN